jgi:predicted transcriptional regulator
MSIDLLDLTADIVIAHASVTEMSSDDLLKEIKTVYATLEVLAAKNEKSSTIESSDRGPYKSARKTKVPVEPVSKTASIEPSIPAAPVLTIEEAFKPDQVACMICGKAGMKTLKRHLSSAHGLKPGQYRKQFNIPRSLPLVASEYVQKRRQIALERGLGDKLAAARDIKKKKRKGTQTIID